MLQCLQLNLWLLSNLFGCLTTHNAFSITIFIGFILGLTDSTQKLAGKFTSGMWHGSYWLGQGYTRKELPRTTDVPCLCSSARMLHRHFLYHPSCCTWHRDTGCQLARLFIWHQQIALSLLKKKIKTFTWWKTSVCLFSCSSLLAQCSPLASLPR